MNQRYVGTYQYIGKSNAIVSGKRAQQTRRVYVYLKRRESRKSSGNRGRRYYNYTSTGGHCSGPSKRRHAYTWYAPGNNTGTIYSGHRHYSAQPPPHGVLSTVPREFTGTIAGNWNYSTTTAVGCCVYRDL